MATLLCVVGDMAFLHLETRLELEVSPLGDRWLIELTTYPRASMKESYKSV